MKILIVGTGYVGLVTGACFAEMGHCVYCLDIDEDKIAMLNNGQMPIYEPGLENLVQRNTKASRLFFITDYQLGVSECDACFLAVPSPSLDDGSCNTSYILRAARQVAAHMHRPIVIIDKSTVPVGTAAAVKEQVAAVLKERNTAISFEVVSNPEFLKEGNAIADCMKPDRIVIGADNETAFKTMREIYAPFCMNREKIIEMGISSAEMTKYAANAMLATRISFMNEIASVCKRVGANVNDVRKGIGSDSRIGYSFLYPGVGYGGSCFPKDIRALRHVAKEVGCHPYLLDAVDHVNNRQKEVLGEYIERYFDKKGGVKGKTIAIWGLSFKPETDDIREAPALALILQLQKKGAALRLYDPVAMENAKKMITNHSNIIWCASEFDAANGADAIALLTEWKQFRLINFAALAAKMQNPAFFDGRNQYLPREIKNSGFDYIGIGVPDLVD